MRATIHTVISLGILVFMILMVAAAIMDMRSRGGSLDDLPAPDIKRAVNG